MSLAQQLATLLEERGLWEKEFTVRRHELLKIEGSTDTQLYYVVDGSLRVFLYHEEEEHTIRFGYQGSFISALDSFISEKPSEFYIQSLKKTKVLAISKTTFMRFINSSPTYAALWQQILGLLIIQQLEREKDLLTSSPQMRYQRVFERSPRLFQEVPHKYIASYLRMTPETLSRLKKKQ